MSQFKIGDPVWAAKPQPNLLNRNCAWPGKIVNPPNGMNRPENMIGPWCVYFFGK